MDEGIKNLTWSEVADDAEDFMRGWIGEPQDLPLLREQWEKKDGDLFEEFVEFLRSNL